jgi:metal-dependent hydrolase (beta-lactamase superfamily II)
LPNEFFPNSEKGGDFSMLRETNRREFLKAAAMTGILLLAGDLLHSYPLVYGAANIPEAGKITITIIIDNYHETTRPSYKIAHRYTGGYLYAQHGLSCHIELVVNGSTHSFLFDFGPTLSGISKNMDELKIDITKIEAFGLSHGHMDHWGSLVDLLRSQKGRISKEIPLYVGEETFVERFSRRPDGVRKAPQLKREDLARRSRSQKGDTN